MNQEILKQYRDLQIEIKELENRIKKLESQAYKIEHDSVIGSSSYFPYTERSFHIEGYNIIEYEKRKRRLNKLIKLLKRRKEMCEELKIKIEEFISNIPDSKTRRVFQYRYIDNLSWQAIAMRLGKVHESYPRRDIHDKYLNSL